jgi:hypothetical protein
LPQFFAFLVAALEPRPVTGNLEVQFEASVAAPPPTELPALDPGGCESLGPAFA